MTVVLKLAWPVSTSVMLMVPVAVRLPLSLALVSSVTAATVGAPITAASLLPLMVKLTVLLVPSALLTVKVSVLVSPAPRYCTALLATV